MIRTLLFSIPLTLLAPILALAEDKLPAGVQQLFNGKNLDGWKVTDFGGEGEVRVEDGQIIMRMGQPLTGITLGRRQQTADRQL